MCLKPDHQPRADHQPLARPQALAAIGVYWVNRMLPLMLGDRDDVRRAFEVFPDNAGTLAAYARGVIEASTAELRARIAAGSLEIALRLGPEGAIA